MKKYQVETIVGIFVAIGICLIAYMAVTLGNVSFFGREAYPLFARFSNVSGLRSGGSVDMFGIEIGKIEALSIDQETQQAIVELRITKGVTIYEDAIASIKTVGLIGDKYISIDPGGAESPLEAGGFIIETQGAIDIVDLIGKYAFGEINNNSGLAPQDN
ncbi:MAG: outer membrane lipid asymmetry maintenance protein MlaD [Syntrophales bacterium]|jgi:phospholipid/cholesterol/gamma-HCH transport system substrate-binding protein|nr:outer membrane lipid asymmetry maintenance protein MlaD [Syntrophales bacterium]